MSRSGYSYDLDNWDLIRYRGRVASAMRGKRGQAFLRDLLAALDALPSQRLIGESFQTVNGEVCALGAIGVRRGVDLSNFDPEYPSGVGDAFGIADCLAKEVMFENDEAWGRETPEQRFQRMRQWVIEHIKEPQFSGNGGSKE